jgi:plastocyanin
MVLARDETITSPGSTTSKTVSVADSSFTPATTPIQVGDTVFWLWGGANHNVVGASGTWCGTRSIGLCFRVFTAAGTFPYTCTFHPGMDGEVDVVATPLSPWARAQLRRARLPRFVEFGHRAIRRHDVV